MDNYEILNSDARVQNMHPKFIAVVEGKHQVLANVVDGTVYLTDEGRSFLADKAEVKPTRKRASKKVEEPVESANELVDEDDFDLGD